MTTGGAPATTDAMAVPRAQPLSARRVGHGIGERFVACLLEQRECEGAVSTALLRIVGPRRTRWRGRSARERSEAEHAAAADPRAQPQIDRQTRDAVRCCHFRCCRRGLSTVSAQLRHEHSLSETQCSRAASSHTVTAHSRPSRMWPTKRHRLAFRSP
jgi:hypothetical protein